MEKGYLKHDGKQYQRLAISTLITMADAHVQNGASSPALAENTYDALDYCSRNLY